MHVSKAVAATHPSFGLPSSLYSIWQKVSVKARHAMPSMAALTQSGAVETPITCQRRAAHVKSGGHYWQRGGGIRQNQLQIKSLLLDLTSMRGRNGACKYFLALHCYAAHRSWLSALRVYVSCKSFKWVCWGRTCLAIHAETVKQFASHLRRSFSPHIYRGYQRLFVVVFSLSNKSRVSLCNRVTQN